MMLIGSSSRPMFEQANARPGELAKVNRVIEMFSSWHNSDGLQSTSFLLLVVMASSLIAMASNLLAMA